MLVGFQRLCRALFVFLEFYEYPLIRKLSSSTSIRRVSLVWLMWRHNSTNS